MKVFKRITNLLNDNNVLYEILHHEPVRTSEEAANVRNDISLSQGAKALICKTKTKFGIEKFIMLVVRGDKRFDSKKVKKLLDVSDVRFASEDEVSKITNGVLPGGVPPFGSLFEIQSYVEPGLLEIEKIAFNAGDRSISIIMKSSDWKIIENPIIINIIK